MYKTNHNIGRPIFAVKFKGTINVKRYLPTDWRTRTALTIKNGAKYFTKEDLRKWHYMGFQINVLRGKVVRIHSIDNEVLDTQDTKHYLQIPDGHDWSETYEVRCYYWHDENKKQYVNKWFFPHTMHERMVNFISFMESKAIILEYEVEKIKVDAKSSFLSSVLHKLTL